MLDRVEVDLSRPNVKFPVIKKSKISKLIARNRFTLVFCAKKALNMKRYEEGIQN